jgi:hypothetical protein
MWINTLNVQASRFHSSPLQNPKTHYSQNNTTQKLQNQTNHNSTKQQKLTIHKSKTTKFKTPKTPKIVEVITAKLQKPTTP